ncbi:MAG TPA: NPCBM/NEW2 domain-containing protein [Chloroflexota bacterium]|nr:NPCBM/NEW2 domain-containing protein [Chloroflexota bacterium]
MDDSQERMSGGMAGEWKMRIALLMAMIAVGLSGFALGKQEGNPPVIADVEPAPATVFLSDLHWDSAGTGWIALADENLPRLDNSFLNTPLAIGGKSYEKGIGTFPLSEIVYTLDGKYSLFEADLGVDESVPSDRGSVTFKLFLDDVLAYDSGVLSSGNAALPLELSVEGIAKMRLVVEDAGDGSSLDYADWGNARLTLASRPGLQPSPELQKLLDGSRLERQQGRNRDWEAVRYQLDQEVGSIYRALGESMPVGPAATASFDPDRQVIVLANNKVGITLGYGGERHGLLSVLDLDTRLLVSGGTTPSLRIADSSAFVLSSQTEPVAGGYRFKWVESPGLGTGLEISADYQVRDAGLIITPRITLYDSSSYFTYQLELREANPNVAVRSFSFFDPTAGGFFAIGEDSVYLTDYSLMRRAEIRDDSILHKEMVGLGKPVVLYNRALSRGVVMAVIDEVSDPAHFSVCLDPGRVTARLGFEHQVPDDVRATTIQTSPRLFFQVAPGPRLGQVTTQFRKVMSDLYPQPKIPDWVKYQWGSWYAFYMGYDEEMIREQIDYISANLSDLGPWSILLDAGWYVAEGRPGSGWEVDMEKFPDGLRPIVDYAHSKNIKVVLYFSAPYLDDREREGNWLGLSGFIEEHPDWVIPLQSDSSGASYVYDFTNPELVQYMRQLISDFFLVYDVDGIKIDGLGQAEGEQLAVEERDVFGDVNKIRMFTMDIYRLIHEEAMKAKKDVYIESGWSIPSYATQFAHTFRYGDEFPSFENRYPAGGLLEHIDYAALQKSVLGQRANMGMVWGGPEAQPMIRKWFEAALAMGNQMTISTDLTHLSSRDLSALRSVLVHYNAFQGDTRVLGVPFVQSFASTVDGITYLGAVNRARQQREQSFRLSDYGLDPSKEYLLYDVDGNRYSKVRDNFSVNMGASSFRLFMLRDTPGLVSTNSSYVAESGLGLLRLSLDGPDELPGFVQLYVPNPTSVWLDGKELARSNRLAVGNSYLYEPSTGILRVRYNHRRPHTLEVRYLPW